MKKIIFTLLTFGLLVLNGNAQYCGNSNPNVCTPSGTLTQPGLSPASDSLPSVINGVANTTVIQFKNYDTLTFGGVGYTIISLRVDSIENLPAGLCWETNKPNNTYGNKEDGCIKVTGTTCVPPGQYRLRIIVTANVGISLQVNAAAAGLFYYVRVRNCGDAEVAVDTTGQTATPQSPSFKAYPGSPAAVCPSVCVENDINDLSNTISSLNVVPNPFNNKAEVSFYSDKSGNMTERITNMIGSEVYNKEIEVKTGENKSTIERSNLPVGVYFYSLGDGKNLVTRRLVISE